VATRKQKVKVGLFLFVCFALAAIGLSLVAGLHEDRGVHHWIVFEESVLGLYDGSTVEYMGVPIGKVRNITVTRQNLVRVEIVIDPNKATLYNGVEARLVVSSIAAGTLAVSVSGGNHNSGELPPNSTIPSKVSALTAISTQLEQLMEKFAAISDGVTSGLEGLEEGSLTKVIDESGNLVADARAMVREATETLKYVREETDGALDQILDAAESIKTFADSAKDLAGTLQTKLAPVELTQIEESLERVLENASNLTAQLEKTASGLDDTLANVTHETGNVEFSLRTSLRELDDTLASLRQLSDQLRDDPASLLRGRSAAEERK